MLLLSDSHILLNHTKKFISLETIIAIHIVITFQSYCKQIMNKTLSTTVDFKSR